MQFEATHLAVAMVRQIVAGFLVHELEFYMGS